LDFKETVARRPESDVTGLDSARTRPVGPPRWS